jgi:hypothetical protein
LTNPDEKLYLEVSDEAGAMKDSVKHLKRVKITIKYFARKQERWLMG